MKEVNFKKDFTGSLPKKSLVSGFTLVELMVVLGIVGVLVLVVWGQVTDALLKGKDAAIKADMDTVRKLAVQEFINLGATYSTTGAIILGDCSILSTAGTIYANPNVQKALIDVKNENGGIAPYCNIPSDGSTYAIAVTLRTPGKYWCIDGTGVAKGVVGTSDTGYNAQSAPNANAAIWSGTYVCN